MNKGFRIYWIMPLVLIVVFLLAMREAHAQTPVTSNWDTWIDPPKNTVIRFTEWGNSIKVEIVDMATPPKVYGTTYMLKSAMMKTTTVRDTIKLPCMCPPPIDCSKWSTYVQTNATLAQTIDKLNLALSEQDRLTEENVKFKDRYSDAVREMKKLQARIDKDTLIFIKVDKSLLKPKN